MQFALVENVASGPKPGLRGTCKSCGTPMIAKCGRHKLWHWAHKNLVHCDPWWESETAWHREWKNKFPEEWQEIIHFDPETGEKHIADVKTDRGLIVEFQHSAMKFEELESREQFYKNMIWIVDGCRGELDAPAFRLGLAAPISENPDAYSLQWWSRSKLFENWMQATRPVFMDFGDVGLWRLVSFNSATKRGELELIGRECFVGDITEGRPLALIGPAELSSTLAPPLQPPAAPPQAAQSQLSLF
jgi:competence protein CoiA